MSDWAVGNLALCVDARANPFWGAAGVRVGATYRVAGVVGPVPNLIWGNSLALSLAGVVDSNPFGFCEHRFVKIKPDAHEACEAEFRILLQLSKKRVSA